MIQVRKIRTFESGKNIGDKFDAQFSSDILAGSHEELFLNLDKILDGINPLDRWNVFYTLSHTEGGERRNFVSQDVIPFDIDGIDVDEEGNFDPKYIDVICSSLKLQKEKIAVVFSGNGFQFLVKLKSPILDRKYFQTNRASYILACHIVDKSLEEAKLGGKADPSAFAPNRLFRLPGTENRKPNKKDRVARLLYNNFTPQDFDLRTIAGLPHVKENDALLLNQIARVKHDEPAVLSGCDFIKWAKKEPQMLSEPQWYALLSLLGRLPNSRKLAHDYSENHPGYIPDETDKKLEQACTASGPRTCENINNLWGECAACPNFQKVNSPISIKSEDFIATEENGFYLHGARGQMLPQFEDLRRFYKKMKHYRTHANSTSVYEYNGKNYQIVPNAVLKNFAHEKFNPKPKDAYANEYCEWVKRTELAHEDWFASVNDKLNFNNGVLNLRTKEFLPHDPSFGFLYCLPFDYSPDAKAPEFEKFLAEVTEGNESLQTLLLEYLGYALCDRSYWLQKAVVLVGDGANGKSTFFEIVQMLSGKENTAHCSLHELQDETNRPQLEGKILNISDELPTYSLQTTEVFKKLMGGGTIIARRRYHDSYNLRNTAKFFFACNELPYTRDTSHGLFRRFIIIPFNARFEQGKNADAHILQKMKPELAGIFNLAMNAYLKMEERGQLSVSDASNELLTEYKETVDTLGMWLKEHLVHTGNEEDFIPNNTLFEKYVGACKRMEERPMGQTRFTQGVYKFTKTKSKWKMVAGKSTRVLKGYKYQDGDEPIANF